MKKRFLALAASAAIAASSLAAVVQADGDITVTLDDKPIEFTDVKPQIVEGDRTVVPFRAIFEALGYKVDWDEPTQTVTGVKGDITLTMTIGSTEATIKTEETPVNTGSGNADTFLEKVVTLDVPAQIIDDRTVVPVRAVAEMSGYTVDWEQDTQTVIITSPADIVTGSGPAVPEGTAAPEASADPNATGAPEATADPNATAAPEATAVPEATAAPKASAAPAASGDLPISYDLRSEDGQANVRNFELVTAEKNADGKYDITFKFETMQEGPGSVDAHFNCLNASGKVVDEFGGSYPSRDYTWTAQESKATISGDTVKIELQKK